MNYSDLTVERIDAATSIADVAECIDAYYEEHVTGGSLHIVLDDYNYEDGHVQFCVEYAEGEHDHTGAALARKLLSLSVEDRAAANDGQFCACGHAMSLHHLWFEGGHGGLSCAGKCDSSGCNCTDAKAIPKKGK